MFQIKTYTQGCILDTPHFFVLSKGLNSGKPSHTPWRNCFVISVSTEEEKERLYWLAYSLWKTKKLYPLLRGSVIEFITLHDYGRQLQHIVSNMPENTVILKMINTLQLLEQKENAVQEQIKNIAALRQSIVTAYLRL